MLRNLFIKWIMWMDKVLIVIQVKKELLMGKVLMVIQVKKELKLNKMMTTLPMLYINKRLRYFLSKKAFDIVNAPQKFSKRLVEIVLDKANAFDNVIILFIANKIEQNEDEGEADFVDEDDETTTNAL